MTSGGPKLPRRSYVPQGNSDPRTGLPLGFSNPPKSEKPEEPKKMKEEVELDEARVDRGLSDEDKVAARAARGYDGGRPVNPGNTSGGQFRGKGPSPYKDSNVAKTGERKGMITKSAIDRTKDKIKSRLNREEVESLEEKNVPTSPEKWSRAKAMAKQKFDVYPSAYANGWAAKKYKEMGGGWKSVSEETDLEEGYFKNQEIERQEKERLAKRNEPPFKADAPKKKSVVVGKKPEGYSIARQLARQGMKKYIKPVKEEKDMSRKAKIVKDVLKKNKSDDTFQAEPTLKTTLTRQY